MYQDKIIPLTSNLIFNREHNLFVYNFPLTETGGKFRIKERLPNGYSSSIAPRKTIILPKHYIEWQISYYNNEVIDNIGYITEANKQIHELSAFLLFGFKYYFISKAEIIKLKNFIETNNIFIENTQEIQRTNFVIENLGGIDFLKSEVSYPLLHHCLGNDMSCEIVIREKQKAKGIMPMLYFYLPMSAICTYDCQSFMYRKIDKNERGHLLIDKNNISIFMQMFKIFGILSPSHKHDCLQILDCILGK